MLWMDEWTDRWINASYLLPNQSFLVYLIISARLVLIFYLSFSIHWDWHSSAEGHDQPCVQWNSEEFWYCSMGHHCVNHFVIHKCIKSSQGIPSVQFSSVAQLCPTLCNPMNCSMPGLPVHHQLLEFTQTHVHQVGDAIQPSHPLSSPFPPAPNPSQHQSLFQWVNSSHEVPKYWSFSFSIIPSKEIPGLISFRMDWLDLLAVQGTLRIQDSFIMSRK